MVNAGFTRIYDQSVGQTAGVLLVSSGKGTPNQNGTDAFAQVTVSGTGSTISSTAGIGNLYAISAASVTDGAISFSATGQYAVIDTAGFEGAAFTVTGFGTGAIEVQWSNNPNAPTFTPGLVITVGVGSADDQITANGQYTASSGGRYMKLYAASLSLGPLVIQPILMAGGLGGGGGGGGGGDATAANQITEIGRLDTIITELGTAPSSLPPIVPYFYAGLTVNTALNRVPVGFSSSSPQTIAASDAGNTWAVFSWELSFTGTPTYPFTMTLENGATDVVIKIPQPGIYSGIYSGVPFAQCSAASTAMTVTISDASARVDGVFTFAGGH